MTEKSDTQERRILDSWKEISEYLRRSEKTCRRWEKELGLPVHRLDETPKARVFAVREELDNWVAEKLNKEEVSTHTKPSFFSRRFQLVSLAILAVGISSIVLFFLLLNKKPTQSFLKGENPKLAVLDFINNTGDSSLTHLKSALSDLLILDLTQSKYVDVLSKARITSALDIKNPQNDNGYKEEHLLNLIEKTGATHIILGSYTKAGETLRLGLTIQETDSMRITHSELVEGKSEDIFSLVDEITKRIKPLFNLSSEKISDDIDRDIGQITTKSLEALKYYSEGLTFDHQKKRAECIAAMEKVIELDPEFAMAYRTLAWCYADLQDIPKVKENIEKAYELSSQTSTRERYLIEGDYYSMINDEYLKAVEYYKKVLEIYPNDSEANLYIGLSYNNLEQFDKSLNYFEMLFQNQDDSLFVHSGLVKCYQKLGRYADAEAVNQYYFDRDPNNISAIYNTIWSHIIQRRYTQAKDIINNSSQDKIKDKYALSGTILLLEDNFEAALKYVQTDHIYSVHKSSISASVYLTKGNYTKALQILDDAIQSGQQQEKHIAAHRKFRALILLKLNKPEAAIKDMTPEIHKEFSLFINGLVALKSGNSDLTENMVNKLNFTATQNQYRMAERLYNYLSGKVAKQKGDQATAIEFLEKAYELIPFQTSDNLNLHAMIIADLAELYRENENLEQAVELLEKITQLTSDRYFHGDVYVKSYFSLGNIYEQKGWTGKAIENYTKFLSLWKDADPDIDTVRIAREQLTQLNNQ